MRLLSLLIIAITAMLVSGCSDEFIEALTSDSSQSSSYHGDNQDVKQAYQAAGVLAQNIANAAISPEAQQLRNQAYYHYINRGLTPSQAEKAADEYVGNELAKRYIQ